MIDSIQDISSNLSTGLRQGMERQSERLKNLPVLVFILIVGLVTPLVLSLGSLRLSVYRVVLLFMFFPILYALFTGRAGRIRGPDICVMLICFWSILSMIVIHGFTDMIEPIGIFVVEVLGAYLVGRVLIRSPEAFRAMVKLFFSLTLLMLPFAIFEAVSGQNIILDMFDKIGKTYPDVSKDPRWGLDRVQGPFAHPIHFGVFFGSLIGITYYVLGYGNSAFSGLWRTIVVIAVGALALSSGPLSALVAQVFFIVWDLILRSVKSRWYILSGLSVLSYFIIDILSNRNPFQVFISYLAFNEGTAYNRVLIWIWGTKTISDNPLFGVGFGDWERPFWMGSSFDMFWLITALRHGLVAGVLFALLFFWIFLQTAFAKVGDPKVQAYRTGYLATMFGLFMAGWTVHYWDATLVLFMFLLASGMWISDDKVPFSTEETGSPANETRQGVRYSRFAPQYQRQGRFGDS